MPHLDVIGSIFAEIGAVTISLEHFHKELSVLRLEAELLKRRMEGAEASFDQASWNETNLQAALSKLRAGMAQINVDVSQLQADISQAATDDS